MLATVKKMLLSVGGATGCVVSSLVNGQTQSFQNPRILEGSASLFFPVLSSFSAFLPLKLPWKLAPPTPTNLCRPSSSGLTSSLCKFTYYLVWEQSFGH